MRSIDQRRGWRRKVSKFLCGAVVVTQRPVRGSVLSETPAESPGSPAAARTCAFYTSHAYPATYNIELNASCGEFTAPSGHVGFAQTLHALELRAARAFGAGEVVAWVPESRHLWEPTIPWPIRHATAEAAAKHPRAYAECVLAVALLVERRDADSRFKHYIASLAQITILEMQNVVTFAKDHLRVLNVSKPELVHSFEEGMSCMEAAQGLIPALQREPSTQGERLWAYGVVKSRAVTLGGRLALVPVVDIANHADPPSAVLELKDASNGAMLRSLRPFAAGDAITISYGNGRANNLELLAKYGFLVPGNRYGVLLPYDFHVALQPDHGDDMRGAGECRDALRSPWLMRNPGGGSTGNDRDATQPLPLDTLPARCLIDRVRDYYGGSQEAALAKAWELVGQLCKQILQKYHDVSSAINRLQQGGQRAGDWVTLQVAHEAVDDMQMLQSCLDSGAAAASAAAAAASSQYDL